MFCFVYRNLKRKGYVYSIKALQGQNTGKVIAYASKIQMHDVVLAVNSKQRDRVRRLLVRNVHAGLIGWIDSVSECEIRLPNTEFQYGVEYADGGTLVTYNPYLYDSFVDKETSEPVHSARKVCVWSGEVRAFDITA